MFEHPFRPLPTIPHHSYISHCFFFLFHHFSHDTLLLFHIHLYHPSDILQPLSIFLFHIKSKTTSTIIVLPCHPFTPSYGHTSSPNDQSYSCTNTSICKTLIYWTFFHSYILFLPFCVIETIFPCSPSSSLIATLLLSKHIQFLRVSCILSQIYFFHPSHSTFIPRFTIPFTLTSLRQIRFTNSISLTPILMKIFESH